MSACDYCVYLEKLKSIGDDKIYNYCIHYLVPDEGKEECDEYFKKED